MQIAKEYGEYNVSAIEYSLKSYASTFLGSILNLVSVFVNIPFALMGFGAMATTVKAVKKNKI